MADIERMELSGLIMSLLTTEVCKLWDGMACCITHVLLEGEAWATWPGHAWLLPPEQHKRPWEEAT